MPLKRSPITICGTIIEAGEHKTVMLPMPKLYDGTDISMPIHVFHGQKKGPTLCVMAAMHGDEVNGVEIIRQLLKRTILKKIVGTLILIPIINVYGFLYQDRYLMDRRDLNRSFPGSAKGSLAARLAYLIRTEIIAQSSYIIDLHTGSLQRSNFPQIRANTEDTEVHALANAFGAPVVLHSSLRDGSLRQYAASQGIPMLVYEAGEALRFDTLSIRIGLHGVLNILKHLNMTPKKKPNSGKAVPALAHASYWLRAPCSGVFKAHKSLGNTIDKGELLGNIGNPMTTEETPIHSPTAGIIIGMSHAAVSHAGAALFHIATFEKLNVVGEQIELLQDALIDEGDIPHD
jgi:predicted deacylase